MSGTIRMNFTGRPSGIVTAWRIFLSRKNRYSDKVSVPEICAERLGFLVDINHLRRFNDACDLKKTGINMLYPFTLAYPLIMRILSSREMPFSVLNVLNTFDTIVQHRELKAGDMLDLRCRNGSPRIVEKGLEMDVHSEISVEGAAVWSIITTYYLRGAFGEAEPAAIKRSMAPLNGSAEKARWFFPARDRFRFARISGDGNGIHYMPRYARSFGFERDFAQPIRVAAKCVDSLPDIPGGEPASLVFHLKGPVYYDRMLTLLTGRSDGGCRFDLFCQGNEKPCISGKMVVSARPVRF